MAERERTEIMGNVERKGRDIKRNIRLGEIVIDKKSYGYREAIVVAKYNGSPKDYLIAY